MFSFKHTHTPLHAIYTDTLVVDARKQIQKYGEGYTLIFCEREHY